MKHSPHPLCRLLIFADGEGSLFSAIINACLRQILLAKVVGLVSSRVGCPVLTRAKRLQIPVKVFSKSDYLSWDLWDVALSSYCQSQKPDLIVLAGFLKKLGPKFLATFSHRIINTHPSLLPHHGGKGMYGIHVHQSVINRGDKETGISVHLVSKDYDSGLILAQKIVPVFAKDSAQSLQKRVKTKERSFYVSVLQKIIQGEIKQVGRVKG